MYKGIIEWEEVFEGDTETGAYAGSSGDPYELIDRLTTYITSGSVITSLEIKRVNKD